MFTFFNTHKKLISLLVVVLLATSIYVFNIDQIKNSNDGQVISAKEALMPANADEYKFSCAPLTHSNLANYQKEWEEFLTSLPDVVCCPKEAHLKCLDSEWELYKEILCVCIHTI